MLRRALREPLLYFLIAGAVLFLVADRFGGTDGRRVVVSEAELARLADQWQAQMGRPPTDAELEGLTGQWIREEIYYREALAMGLDENDVIIRRRLAQKLTFLTEDLATGEPATEAQLQAYYRANADRYMEPQRFSFVHRYFSSERREEAEEDARAALDAVNASEGADAAPEGDLEGDPFMLQRSYVERSARDIGELFGREFAAALVKLPVGSWQGPIRSAYGWHLVRVEQARPSRTLPFDDVVQGVAADFRQQQRQAANEAFYQSLLERYEIVRP